MKITVDLPEKELREISRLTGITKKGPAIRQLLTDALLHRRRAELTEHYLTGSWSADLASYESSRAADRAASTTLAEQWRD
jgi:hypothetical protein